MRKVKEILRLKWEAGLGFRQIGRSCQLSHHTVKDYVARAEAAASRTHLGMFRQIIQ